MFFSSDVTEPTIDCRCVIRGIIDADGNLTAEYDVATANWGGSWRMPTLAEMKELINNCTWEWTTQNGVYGRKVTGPNGNSIFLPLAIATILRSAMRAPTASRLSERSETILSR